MGKKLGIAFLMILMLTALGACRVEQTEEGELPEVDVQGGQLPEYDVDTADVDVGTQTAQVTVPEVDVKTETAQVTVPDVDVNMPPENKKPPQQ